MLSDIDNKISQAQRNTKQGELGHALAINKINEIKLSLA